MLLQKIYVIAWFKCKYPYRFVSTWTHKPTLFRTSWEISQRNINPLNFISPPPHEWKYPHLMTSQTMDYHKGCLSGVWKERKGGRTGGICCLIFILKTASNCKCKYERKVNARNFMLNKLLRLRWWFSQENDYYDDIYKKIMGDIYKKVVTI